MELKTITLEQREELRKALPEEAISQHPTKTYLSTIKAIYVVERLNDVFGVGGWHIENEIIKEQIIETESRTKTMVVMKGTLKINGYDVHVEQFGGNDNDDLGDAYKGAATDALTKIGSYLEIGIDVFKGKVKPPKKPERPFMQNFNGGKAVPKGGNKDESFNPEGELPSIQVNEM